MATRRLQSLDGGLREVLASALADEKDLLTKVLQVSGFTRMLVLEYMRVPDGNHFVPQSAHEAQCFTHSATISACEKAQQRMPAAALLREMQQWHPKLKASHTGPPSVPARRPSGGCQLRPCCERCSSGT